MSLTAQLSSPTTLRRVLAFDAASGAGTGVLHLLLAPLIARGLIGADLRPKAGCDALLAFYAAPIWQRLEDAATRQT